MRVLRRTGATNVFEIDGELYATISNFHIEMSHDEVTLTFQGRDPVDRCEHCGRADWQDRVARAANFEEALGIAERTGWIWKVPGEAR